MIGITEVASVFANMIGSTLVMALVVGGVMRVVRNKNEKRDS